MRAFCVFAILLVAGLALAVLPGGEKKLSADAGINLTGHTTVELLADGEAKIRLWSGGVRFPYSASGDTWYTIQDGLPRSFEPSGAGLDSIYVDLVDASYVIVTWR